MVLGVDLGHNSTAYGLAPATKKEALVKVAEKQWPERVVICRPVPSWRPTTPLPIFERTGRKAKKQKVGPDDREFFAMELPKLTMSEIMST